MWRYTVFTLMLIAATSVHSKGKAVKKYKVIYDGAGVSPSQQCRDNHYEAACYADNPADRCTQLKCTQGRGDIPEYNTFDIGPAKQGTPCGDKKICVGAQCVDDWRPSASSVVENNKEYDCIVDQEYEHLSVLLA